MKTIKVMYQAILPKEWKDLKVEEVLDLVKGGVRWPINNVSLFNKLEEDQDGSITIYRKKWEPQDVEDKDDNTMVTGYLGTVINRILRSNER